MNRQSDSTMRYFGSSYFLGALLLALLLLSVRHISVTGQNSDLQARFETMETQMKTDKFNLQTMEATLSQKNEEIEKLRTEKSQFDERINAKDQEIQAASNNCNDLEKSKVDADEQVADLLEKLRQCETSKESSAADLNATLEAKNKAIQDLTARLEKLNPEPQQPKMSRFTGFHGRGSVQMAPSPGQLPLVDPRAVVVKEKANKGMTFHKDDFGRYLPILPKAPRGTLRKSPRFSVVNMKSEDVFKNRKMDDLKDAIVTTRKSNFSEAFSSNATTADSRLLDITSTTKYLGESLIDAEQDITNGAELREYTSNLKPTGEKNSSVTIDTNRPNVEIDLHSPSMANPETNPSSDRNNSTWEGPTLRGRVHPGSSHPAQGPRTTRVGIDHLPMEGEKTEN
ncbi:uncharacterized protein LOC131879137 isoform X2 [Tigriopus californicus]|uniref:uncharacterized protein LOC131879137 isoform X2 n=1 Tax=Tigriopus californicus TaxID=6832 RepID=UPI0027D9DF41|nr:uncharacterized protein LOC131879137 isoform X2 [Tigriopus californicus]|eukprot:TCALIF_05365-PA protein Name:"Protein of unknown function" AED:0.00 eAED:0.00 QI:847/1/1/1/0.5/0.57/7/945/397